MAFGSKEKEARNLIHEHLNLVEKCVQVTLTAFGAYMNGEAKKASALDEEVNAVESEADKMRRRIARKLFEGAFLPMMREPFLDFVKQTDHIADAAERVCETLFLTQIDIPDEFKSDLMEIAGNATSAIKLLRNAFDAVFVNIADVLDLVHECTAVEHLVDCRLEDVLRRIFSSGLPLAHKMQLYDLIEKIDDIIDVTEDAADVLENLTVITSV